MLGYKNVNVVNATQFGIVAVSNGTTVTITPGTENHRTTSGNLVLYTVNLNEGETYLLRNGNSMPADLSGSLITSNFTGKAVFGGHQCKYSCRDIMHVTTKPNKYLLQQYGEKNSSEPLATRLNGDMEDSGFGRQYKCFNKQLYRRQ